jgi:light-regulated signal transduction histidine kinase (bacteriophytochrome)
MEEALRESEQRYKSLHAELEVRVLDRTAELERKNQELQEFAFVASHALAEPLRKIQTFGDLLKAKSEDRLGELEKDYVSRMSGAANRMQSLLDALLKYSRIESKGQEFRPSKLDDIVMDAVKDLEVPIQKIGARVEISHLPIINCDPYQGRQLFQNLIANSLKYYRSEVKPLVRVYGEEKNGHCRIFVEDNGIGFDEKYLDKIFQPFQRLHGKNAVQNRGATRLTQMQTHQFLFVTHDGGGIRQPVFFSLIQMVTTSSEMPFGPLSVPLIRSRSPYAVSRKRLRNKAIFASGGEW